VLQNYLRNKPKFLGIGNYTEEGFAYMEKAVPQNFTMIKKALNSSVRAIGGFNLYAQ